MLEKVFYKSAHRQFCVITLVGITLISGGCKTNLSSQSDSAPTQNQQQAPPAPIVVDGVRTSYADVVDKTSPAVVQIEAEQKSREISAPQANSPLDDPQMREFFKNLPQQPQKPRIQRGVGSGVIVSADGMILTNYHVVGDADKITVLMNDNNSFRAKVVGTDQPSDLAVLKIEGENLPFLNLGNSDGVRIGDIVLAIGNPLGIGQTVTAGIISAKGRRTDLSAGSFEDFLQTDAPINQGNSGGALVNLTGELIGINSQILSSAGGGGNIGIGFSIPSNMAKSVMEQLVQNGKVRRGMLGVEIRDISVDMAQALELKDRKGVLVNNVRPASSAAKAGVRRGDVITAINGERVEDSNILRNKVAATLPGNSIKISVLRNGDAQELTAMLDEFDVADGKPPTSKPEQKGADNSSENGKLGLSLQSATPELLKQFDLPDDVEGLIVTEIDPNGSAAEEGIAPGDLIIEINQISVTSTGKVQAALEKSGDKPILLLINRKGRITYLTVNPNR